MRVVLSGKRRDYLIKELDKNNIDYSYFKMVSVKNLNELYNLLDLYIVSSRVEGGPQAILECALTKTPLISTDVGIANKILHDESLYNMDNFSLAKPNVEYSFNKAQDYVIPKGFTYFHKIFKEINES